MADEPILGIRPDTMIRMLKERDALRVERDELLAACEAVCSRAMIFEIAQVPSFEAAIAQARAAIRSVKGDG